MPLILQIETSTDVCSIALCKNGVLVYCAETEDFNSHTEKLTLLIQQAMDECKFTYKQLDAIAVSSGPGSYTSLRIGASTSKGICYALERPLITLDSLLILSAGIDKTLIQTNDIIIPMIDARRMEVYASVYDINLKPLASVDAIILDEHSFEAYDNTYLHLCGNGAEKYISAFPSGRLKLHHKKTSASYMTSLALLAYEKNNFSDVAYYSPEYFKAPNITKSLKKIF